MENEKKRHLHLPIYTHIYNILEKIHTKLPIVVASGEKWAIAGRRVGKLLTVYYFTV